MTEKFFLFFFVLCISVLYSKEPHLISVGAGVFDLKHKKHRTAEFRIEYRPSVEYYTIRPTVGAFITAKASFYLYGGFGLEWFYKRLFFSPNFATGLYLKGKGKDLGFPIEFRSGLELGARLDDGSRLGIHFYHISNARKLFHWSRKNPGEESLVFFYAFPL